VVGPDLLFRELPAAGEQRIAHPAAQAHLLLGLPALKRGDPDFFPLARRQLHARRWRLSFRA
jgi:hypothetical protein